MSTYGLKKQISLFLPLDEWKAIRNEAARQRIPMTELVRGWIKPEVSGLQSDTAEAQPSE